MSKSHRLWGAHIEVLVNFPELPGFEPLQTTEGWEYTCLALALYIIYSAAEM